MKILNIDKIVNSYGNIPGDLMNFGFLLLNPAKLMIYKYQGSAKNIEDAPFVEDFIRMEK
ncbi:MAG: hypothetical protein KAQ71_20720 [Desulfobulbaceae bacterium]|nr:hypothetical protein [Desulfobulbaceae bacterium]